MIQKSRIWREFESLSPAAQRQVADFIGELRTQAEERVSPNTPPFREEPFVGLWADREDLLQSDTWVRCLRETEWTSR
jgi:hypothetical protein